MKLSFIVVTYHRPEAFRACLTSIYNQQALPMPFEIIVIDNSGTMVLPRLHDFEVMPTVYHTETNLGVAGGRNLGIEKATGDYLVFIDDDAVWHRPDDVARLVGHLDVNPQIAGVAVQVIDPSDESVIINLLPHPNKKNGVQCCRSD